jgi:hypothetical protein
MTGTRGFILLALLVATPATVTTANVVTDWDAKAVGIVQSGTAPPPPLGFRTMAILHTAMFEAYIPTPITYGWALATMTPFALVSPSQFRAKPPPSLKSAEWARDSNEIKDIGAKNSTKRTARQTEDARLWLVGGPLAFG